MFAVVLTLLLAGCIWGSDEVAQTEIVVTRDRSPNPPSCAPLPVAAIVIEFFAAVNAGDERALGRIFPRESFRWYSVEGGPGERSVYSSPYDWTTLLPYFEERHEQGERLRLVEIFAPGGAIVREVQGLPIEPTPAADIEFVVERRADDFSDADSTRYGGKAGINCRDRAIFYWSMGPDAAPDRPLCPRPTADVPRHAVVACG